MRYVVVLLLLALAPTAQAADPARYLDTARSLWPGSPCAGQETITTDVPPGFDGLAWSDSCRVTVSPSLSEYATCVTLAHELGHLAGREHSLDPNDVMYNPPARVYAHACYKAVPRRPVPFSRAKSAIEWLTLGEPIQCRRSGLGAVCRAGTARWRITDDPYRGITKKRLRDGSAASSR